MCVKKAKISHMMICVITYHQCDSPYGYVDIHIIYVHLHNYAHVGPHYDIWTHIDLHIYMWTLICKDGPTYLKIHAHDVTYIIYVDSHIIIM